MTARNIDPPLLLLKIKLLLAWALKSTVEVSPALRWIV
jgi:hypothetical protein